MVRELIFYFKEMLRNFQGIFCNWTLKSGSTAIFKYIKYTNSQRNIILGGIIIVFKYNLTTISSEYMILHHIYKELNLLLYIFINLRDF